MTTVRVTVCCALLLLGATWAEGSPCRERAALEGLERIHNEEFERAHAIYDALIVAEPDRPEGYFGRALAYWDEGLILEDGDRFDRETIRYLEAVIRVSEKAVERQGETAEMLFWLGSAYGLRATLAMVRNRVLRGVRDGLKSRSLLRRSVELDPDRVDACFGLGLTDYVVSRKPLILRLVSRLLFLPSGDRAAGLAALDRVATKGTYCRSYAISSRAFIELYYEKNPEEAMIRFARLLRQYPNSLDFRIRYVDALFALSMRGRVGFRQGLIDSARSARKMAAERGWALERWTRTKLDFIEGFGHYLTMAFGEAKALMETYLREADRKSWLLGPAELILGKVSDLDGDRRAAVERYRRALRREDVWGTHAEARRYLKRPFSGKERSSRPHDLVRRYPDRP